VQVFAHVDVTPEDMNSISYRAPILPCSAAPRPRPARAYSFL
jgi:hypothetical protein